ncbi:MAG: hypothetical protein PW843_23890 [Azospirillaceae bacterium]|nr:hypothetical protein [Azospirillaceae bacterium]
MADTATGDRPPRQTTFLTEIEMTDMTMSTGRSFNAAQAGFSPKGLMPNLRDLPVLLAAALFAVAIVSLF